MYLFLLNGSLAECGILGWRFSSELWKYCFTFYHFLLLMRTCCHCGKALDGSVCADATSWSQLSCSRRSHTHSCCRIKTHRCNRGHCCGAPREISQPLPAHAVRSRTKPELQLSDDTQGWCLCSCCKETQGAKFWALPSLLGHIFVPTQIPRQEHLWQKEFWCWEDSRKDRISFDPHNSSRHGYYFPKIRIEEIPHPREHS